jgi:DNA primase
VSLSPAFLDELRARTSLSSLIGRKVKLTKAGREMKGCCPFHGEKTPSFYVNDDKAFYHCFGCSAHGDAIRWMTDHEGMEFLDAVKALADAAGLEMPARDPQHAEKDAAREEMLAIMARASRWYGSKLVHAGDGAKAREYLAERGITEKLAYDFDIGFAPASGGVRTDNLRDVRTDRLIQLGLVRMRDGSDDPYDFFRGRIMFPIHDHRGRVIAFGGRILGNGEPKYLNSPDTPVFDKGATLYNLHRAAPAARAAKRLIVVEGYMDVIGLAGAGVLESVAPNGTALTEAQISRLWRLADNPILCFDGDKAGKAAAARAAIRALPLLQPDRSLQFVTPPGGMDPDDVARKGGLEAVNAMLASPRPLVDVIWEHELAAGPVDTPEQRAGLAKRLREHAATIRNGSVANAYLDEFKSRYERQTARPAPPRRAPLPGKANERKPFSRPQSGASKAIARSGNSTNIERAILAGLLRHPEIAAREFETIVEINWNNPAAKALADLIVDAAIGRRDVVIPPELEAARDFALAGPLRMSFTLHMADIDRARAELTTALHQLCRLRR